MSGNYSLHRRSTSGGDLLWFCYRKSSFSLGRHFRRRFNGWPSTRVRMEYCTWLVSSSEHAISCLTTRAVSRYRTPLCVFFSPKIIAAACYVLAQRIHDGPNSPSLDARISATASSMSLPTPPTHKPPSPDATRFAIEHFQLIEDELSSVAGMVKSICVCVFRSDFSTQLLLWYFLISTMHKT